MFEAFKTCGWPSFVVTFVALVALVVSCLAVVASLSRANWARTATLVAASFALVPAGIGVSGMMYGRPATDQALSSGAVEPALEARIQEAGYAESLTCVQMGGDGSALPVLLAVAALVLPHSLRKPGAA